MAVESKKWLADRVEDVMARLNDIPSAPAVDTQVRVHSACPPRAVQGAVLQMW